MSYTSWLVEHYGLIATFLWAACELLNQIPSIKSNTVLELIISGVIDLVKGKVIAQPIVPPPDDKK
jgi:hypothetical protein